MRAMKRNTILGAVTLCTALSSGMVWADARITFHGTLLDAPTCEINNNQDIDVDFGDDMVISRVNGANYKKEIVYTLSCEDAASSAMRLTLKGTLATFGSGLLMTSKAGLAIQLYNGSTKLAPGTGINFTYPYKPELYAIPEANDTSTLTAGYFTSTATMVIDYQ